MTDDQARNVQQYEYDSFGNQHDMKNRIKQPYGYTGREHDRETGLRYYRARFYDGEVGVFLSKDPIGFNSGQTNHYSYVGNNPVNWADPFGLAKANCTEDLAALMKLIEYEQAHGKYGAVRGEYNPFSTTLTDLNKDYESTFGKVDIDWMLRSSGFGLAGNGTLGAFGAWMDYRVSKFYWNVGRSIAYDTKLEFDTVFDEANHNAPHAVAEWLNSDNSLSDLFRPYLERCLCP